MGTRTYLLLLALFAALVAAACGSNHGSVFDKGGGTDASVGDAAPSDGSSGGDGSLISGDGGTGQGTLAISPQNPTIAVSNGSVPTQAFTTTLTLNGASQTVTSVFTLTDYTVGTISGAGTFTPKGTIAGTATVVAA